MEQENDQYISDIVDLAKMRTDQFNLIASSCGTGKSYFVEKYLLEKMPDIKPNEIIFLTSRAITVDQHTEGEYGESLNKFNVRDYEMIRQWNGASVSTDELAADKIQIMTYDKLIYILMNCNNLDKETLSEIKIIVLDECHVLFSDMYIRSIEVLRIWIRDCLYRGDKYFLGMTATPRILFFNQQRWGVRINQLNEKILVNYKVQKLICTNYNYIPDLIKDHFTGKTIIMCYSIKDCFYLQEKIPNSAVLVSKNNEAYNRQNMEYIRNHIIRNDTLPEDVLIDGKKLELDVLITTSTLREGINLNESSGIKNVVCCIPDELHISQFVGRCRFNIENLVIANEYMQHASYMDRYLVKCRQDFTNYILDNANDEWLQSINHLLVNPQEKPLKFYFDSESFYKQLQSDWLNKKIYKKDDRNKLVEIATWCKIFKCKNSDATFNALMKIIKEHGEFDVVSGRSVVGGHKYTYKIIKLKEKQ